MTPESSSPYFPRPFSDEYELLALLGKGGWGRVYRAYQKSLRREVALKVIAPGRAETEGAVQRFQIEAQCAPSLG